VPGQAALGLRQAFREAFRTKSGIAGSFMLAVLLGMVIIIPFVAPYDVVSTWGDRSEWIDNPRLAAPAWTEWFAGRDLPETMIFEPSDFRKVRVPSSQFNLTFVVLRKTFTYAADEFPSELTLWAWASFATNSTPNLNVTWIRPDGETVTLLDRGLEIRAPTPNEYPFSQTGTTKNTAQAIRNWALGHNATETAPANKPDPWTYVKPEVTLFAVAGEDMLDFRRAKVLKGEYTLRLDYLGFSTTEDLDAKFIVYGTIFGLAGTDDARRDLFIGFLWGAPVALAFGTVAALVIVLIQTILGAISGWYGGWIDEIVQRFSDGLLIIPLLPILIIIALFYDPGIVVILLVLVAFGFVGSTTKVIRSLVLQIREEQYIEAAQSYGASRARILFRYIMPRVMPYTFALIALSVPSYIFLEASLSFLGLGDPVLPTWGAVIGDAYSDGALYYGYWWWIAVPTAGILFTTVAFALLGYAFDKVLNPRLREE